MKNRVLAMVLVFFLCLGIICTFIPSALAFTDITDSDTAEAAEILRLLGVVNGTGGNAFNPNGTLTRAAFCKMALETAGRGKEALAQSNRVVFPDVSASHWALGYVNAAASAPAKDVAPLIRGRGDGRFWPDTNVTYGEAVTILMRMLGYDDSDVGAGAMWYDGYLATAADVDLTDGLNRAGTAVISRGEAARLFEQLLFTKLKDSSDVYLTKLGGSVTATAIVLSTDATADDGTTGSVKTTLATYKTDRTTFSADLEGTRGQLVLDKSGKLLAVRPEDTDTLRRVSIVSCDADHVVIAGGETLKVSLDTVVWKDGSASTYEKEWASLRAATQLVFCYNGAGKADYIFFPTAANAKTAIVAKSASITTNPFASLAGGSIGYSMYKNGVTAALSDIRQYDVGTYNKSANAIYISDLRLTGIYESAYPNVTAPSTVTVMGAQFSLLPGAITDLSAFSIGNTVTLLLTGDLQVAGVVSATAARSTAVGMAQMSGTSATVELLDGRITLSGNTTLAADSAAALDGQLVTVSSGRAGYLSLAKITGSEVTSGFNVASRTIGTKKLAENAKIYEQVGTGSLVEISLSDLTVAAVPNSKISFVSVDYAGNINHLVLRDVTGDRYSYGYFVYTPSVAGGTMSPDTNATLAIRNADASGDETTSTPIECGASVTNGQPGGIAVTARGKLAAYVTLQSVSNLRRSAFDLEAMTVTTSDAVYPVWEDVQCYNKTSGKWYLPGDDGLAYALAFSDNLTIYYDRTPESGGKVRLVVVY